MAKAATNTKSNTTAASAPVSGFVSDFVDDLPAATGRGGRGFAASSDVTAIKGLAAPQAKDGGGFRYARLWYAVPEAPAAITSADERAKWQKDEARKMTNRFSGIARRISKKDANYAFTIRSVEHEGKPGVGVYRVNPTPAAPAASAPAASAPAAPASA